MLILDRERGDPKWILATVATPGDIRPARPDAIVDEVTAAWVASAGRPVPSRAHIPARRAVLARRWREQAAVGAGSRPASAG